MRTLWLGVLAGGLCLLAVGCARHGVGEAWEVVTPGTFREELSERGWVGSEREIQLAAPYSGKVDTLVEEGTLVKAHETVGQMDTFERRDKWEHARLEARQKALQQPLTRQNGQFARWQLGLAAENARLDLAIEKLHFQDLVSGRAGRDIVDAAQGIGALKAEQAVLKSTLPEAQTLVVKGYMALEEIRQMRKRQGEIAAELRAQQARLKALEAGPRASDVTLAALKVEQAASALGSAREQWHAGRVGADADDRNAGLQRLRTQILERESAQLLASGSLKAPADGVVIYQQIWTGSDLAKLKPGDTVDEGATLLMISDPRRQLVRALVGEAASARLRAGTRVRCRFDAYPGLVVLGRLSRIAPVASPRLVGDRNKLQAVEVRVAIDHPDARLRPGMSANVAFELLEKPNCLVVPLEAVERAGDARALWVREGDRAVRRVVQLGAANEREVVVTAGLAAGDRVLLRAPGSRP